MLWVPEGDVLVAQVIWRSGSADVSELESVIRELRLPRGVGLAGEVWESGAPRHVPEPRRRTPVTRRRRWPG